MKNLFFFFIMISVVVLTGCTKKGMYLPVTPGSFAIALPAQQKTISDAVNQAVWNVPKRDKEGKIMKTEKEDIIIDKDYFSAFSPLKGKTAFVEVSTVLSASADLAKYVRHNLEAKFAELGVRIVPVNFNLLPTGEIQMNYPTNVDYRILVTIDRIGADSTTKKYVPPLNVFFSDKYFYEGLIAGYIIAYSLTTDAPAIKKEIFGKGQQLEIKGLYTESIEDK